MSNKQRPYFEYVSKYTLDLPLLPERKTAEAAGYDLYTLKDVYVEPWQPTLISTGVKCALEPGTFLQLQLRSSIPMKMPIIMSNAPGIIDADYYNNEANEGEIFIQVLNYSSKGILIRKHTRLAQGIVLPYAKVAGDNVATERTGGFGSTNNPSPGSVN